MTDTFQLLPPLTSDERERLKADIESNGIADPVVVDAETGAIIDGHHRRDIAAELDIELPTRPVAFGSDGERSAFAYRANLNRRHLTREQAKAVREGMKELAKALYADYTQEQIGGMLGVTQQTVGNWLDTSDTRVGKASNTKDKRTKVDKKDKEEIVVRAKAGEPQAQIAADHGISQQRAGQIITEETAKAEERERKIAAAETFAPNIICTPINEAHNHIKHGSIDVIITDPPYPKEHLHTFSELSAAASVLLKPGGLCIVMSGQYHLPDVFQLLGESLDYYWTMAYDTTKGGQKVNIRHRNVQVMWKPILVYSNGPSDPAFFKDTVSSDRNDKAHHDWGQSLSGMTAIVEQFSEPGDLVYDPFVGGGTTAIAAIRLDRRFIGSDNDEEQCRLTTTRMAEDAKV